MKAKTDLANNIKLIPVFKQDPETGEYDVHYKGFLKAFSRGKTQQEAELSLLQIFIVLLKERKEKIREQGLNIYYSDL